MRVVGLFPLKDLKDTKLPNDSFPEEKHRVIELVSLEAADESH